jgi:hypothetical protein
LGEDGGCEGDLGELVAQAADFLALRGEAVACLVKFFVTSRPWKRGASATAASAPGGGPGDALAGGEAVFEARGGVGGGQGGLDVEDAHVPVLDCEGDQPAGAAGDVPGQSSPESGHADRSAGVVGDGLVRYPVTGGFAVGPGDEVFDPPVQGFVPQGAGVAAVPDPEGVVGGAEEKLADGNDALQGTSRSSLAETWFPSASVTFL